MRILLVLLIAISGGVGLQQMRMVQRADLDEVSAVATADVIVYVTSWCEECDQAQAHLDASGVDYLARDIETRPEAYDAYRARGGAGAVPMIVIGDETLVGFDPETVDLRLAALDT